MVRGDPYTPREETDMCLFLIELSREGLMVQPKSRGVWEEFAKRKRSRRTAQSLTSHFARYVLPHIHRMTLKFDEMSTLLKAYEIPISPEVREYLERKFSCTIVLTSRGVVEDFFLNDSTRVRVKASTRPPETSWDFGHFYGDEKAKKVMEETRRKSVDSARSGSSKASTSGVDTIERRFRKRSLDAPCASAEERKKRAFSPIRYLKEFPSWAKYIPTVSYEHFWADSQDPRVDIVEEQEQVTPTKSPRTTPSKISSTTDVNMTLKKARIRRCCRIARKPDDDQEVESIQKISLPQSMATQDIAKAYLHPSPVKTLETQRRGGLEQYLLPAHKMPSWCEGYSETGQLRASRLDAFFKLIELVNWQVDPTQSDRSLESRRLEAARLLVRTSRAKEREIFEESKSKKEYQQQITHAQKELTEILERVNADNVEDEDDKKKEEEEKKSHKYRRVTIEDESPEDERDILEEAASILEKVEQDKEKEKNGGKPEPSTLQVKEEPKEDEKIPRVPTVEPFNIELASVPEVDPDSAPLSRRQRVHMLRSLVSSASPAFASLLQRIEANIYRNSRSESTAARSLREASERINRLLENFQP